MTTTPTAQMSNTILLTKALLMMITLNVIEELVLSHVSELVDALLEGDFSADELLVVLVDGGHVAAEDGGAERGFGSSPIRLKVI